MYVRLARELIFLLAVSICKKRRASISIQVLHCSIYSLTMNGALALSPFFSTAIAALKLCPSRLPILFLLRPGRTEECTYNGIEEHAGRKLWGKTLTAALAQFNKLFCSFQHQQQPSM